MSLSSSIDVLIGLMSSSKNAINATSKGSVGNDMSDEDTKKARRNMTYAEALIGH